MGAWVVPLLRSSVFVLYLYTQGSISGFALITPWALQGCRAYGTQPSPPTNQSHTITHIKNRTIHPFKIQRHTYWNLTMHTFKFSNIHHSKFNGAHIKNRTIHPFKIQRHTHWNLTMHTFKFNNIHHSKFNGAHIQIEQYTHSCNEPWKGDTYP